MTETNPPQPRSGKMSVASVIPALALSCTIAMIMTLSIPMAALDTVPHMDRPNGLRRMLTILNNQTVANRLIVKNQKVRMAVSGSDRPR